ncbi:hypothetical protein E4U16_004272 [Claviceps sp. LM84 group G4]|nr:hypothetical protein E4U33_003875 [Claviceps sp. LM78 group G4]KAG6074056.1 hypothetical protein E4U16_004272 [Claviceps sp. LM84 group G4]
MPSGEYSTIGSGALKLKGAKIQKKKKKRKPKVDLDKDLAIQKREADDAQNSDDQDKQRPEQNGDHEDAGEEVLEPRKTEAERRYEEVKRKRVSRATLVDADENVAKTMKLLKLAESSTARPELLKTHKERVEELNTYLSKLSEHHDMPKIGPG